MRTIYIFILLLSLTSIASADSLNVFGDSFSDTSTVNGIAYSGKYPSTLKNETIYTTIINEANSGKSLTDVTTLNKIYRNHTIQNDSLVMLGYNDMRQKSNTSLNLTAFNETYEAVMAFVTLDNSSKVFSDDPRVRYNGTWNNQAVYSRRVYYTNEVGANVSFNFTGTKLFIGSIKGYNAGYTDISKGFNVSIDGIVVGNYTGNTNFTSPEGTTTHPFLIAITGLSNTYHDVVINYNGSGAVSANIRFDWYSNETTPSKKLYVGNVVRMKNYLASPTAANGSDASVIEYNQAILHNVNRLNSFGFTKIYYVDVSSSYNPSTDIGADEIHPNAAGFRSISNVFESVINMVNPESPTASYSAITPIISLLGLIVAIVLMVLVVKISLTNVHEIRTTDDLIKRILIVVFALYLIGATLTAFQVF